MRYKALPSDFYLNNRKNLKELLKQKSLAIINSNDEMPRNGDQFFPFRQNSDLFYLTGIEQEKTILCLCPEHPEENKREILFIIKPDPKMETWLGHKLTKEEAKEISGVETIMWLDDFDSTLKDLMVHSQRAVSQPKRISKIHHRRTIQGFTFCKRNQRRISGT
jgi:Xaa-Pro aminopeptidase